MSKAEDNEEDDNGKSGSSKWCCRFLDVGGYGWVEPADLRKIRSDFLELPFQVGSHSVSWFQGNGWVFKAVFIIFH